MKEETKSIVINTPTSNIGRPLAARLLDAGERVTVLSRDKKKVDEFLRRGARVVEGSFEEPAPVGSEMNGFHLGFSSLQEISACERTTCLLDQPSISKISKINDRIAKSF